MTFILWVCQFAPRILHVGSLSAELNDTMSQINMSAELTTEEIAEDTPHLFEELCMDGASAGRHGRAPLTVADVRAFYGRVNPDKVSDTEYIMHATRRIRCSSSKESSGSSTV